jgi:shikimate 5-dehydrogenase
VQRAAAGVEGEVGFGPHVAADVVGEDVAGAFVAVASDFGGFAAALNLKTTVEPRIDRMDPDAKPMGAANDYP